MLMRRLSLGYRNYEEDAPELRFLFFESPFSSLRYLTLWFLEALQLFVWS